MPVIFVSICLILPLRNRRYAGAINRRYAGAINRQVQEQKSITE